MDFLLFLGAANLSLHLLLFVYEGPYRIVRLMIYMDSLIFSVKQSFKSDYNNSHEAIPNEGSL